MKERYQKGNWKAFVHLVRQTKPSVWMLSAAVTLSIISTLVSLVVPLFTKGLVDSFTVDSIKPAQIVMLVVSFVVSAIAGGISIYLLNRLGQEVVAKLRDRLWKKLLKLTIPYYDNHRTGDTISRMTNDTAVLKGLVSEHVTGFFNGVISMVGAIVILLLLDWKMTLIILAAIPVTAAVLVPLGRIMLQISRKLQDETADFTTILNQVLSEIRLVKASNAEERETGVGQKAIEGLLKLGIREGKIQAFIGPIISFVMMGLMVLIIGYGGMRVSSGALSAGDLVAFILYLVQIIMPMNQITMFFTQLQKSVGATERIVNILEDRQENVSDGKTLTGPVQTIQVEHVHFSYEKGDAVLHDISFTLEPGKVTAVVGPSGGGKTTLFSIIERFYLPDSGMIRVGGQDVSGYSLESWRRQIGYVPQESPIIAGTIRDNICYGMDRDVADEEVERAAHMAYADIFINELPEGYRTEVGERGIKLSGGQRQRISIARALLRNPQILMLDEATSSLDSQSEVFVQKALQNLMKGRTTMVIAHRLSTVVDADQILFIEKGRITGVGTHQELIESHSMYREFAHQQLRIADSIS
ncbi:ATP-binding cassette domain-containing protein [Paenibacillus sp. HJL G12]|uniref:ATP-binding cassette domain-containing protein n=1 Tax=Paenibacillus dendrobii TaxID=2691084 RepID=A0A7X3LH10_9BACL|nr:ABC transporter ATP-binding protein [Paenibacillus dendrobii]MWV43058.1 ATP-binding cassette domain-containing protein [Paenibacillus dendrobii]